ncbi:tetratricopeptide repeat protein [Sphingomonas sp. FW199]|uniref:SPOR domain-containing protein n=1 Tax=Sphingomonas sp. FW199 TaxID=3400217 RepID=UPI003CF53068
MNGRTFATLSASVLILGTAMVGCSTQPMGIATASSVALSPDAKKAVRIAANAERALLARKHGAAIAQAEHAVALVPDNAAYRSLLARAYLAAGRFDSAAQAFSDALVLDPANGRSALNLALAQTALGQWAEARDTLKTYEAQIGATDRGLALALAGDPDGGVAVLAVAAREPTADAVTRQNFALVLALSGRWREAQAVAAVDLAPAEVEKRLIEWAAFARPATASDQVAALLGVVPIEDPGQPVHLALNAAPSVADATAETPPPAPEAPAVETPAPAAEPAAVVAEPPVAVAPVADLSMTQGVGPSISFAPRAEIVQPLPVRTVAAKRPSFMRMDRPAPVAGKAKPYAAPARGEFFVQLGAFENDAVAKDSWNRLTRRIGALKGMTPSGMTATVNGVSYYRLSIGGFARPDADRLCRDVKRSGGTCFVRSGAGDKLATWFRSGVRAASK